MVNWEFMRDRANPELVDWRSAEAIINAKQYEALVKWPSMWRNQASMLFIAGEKIFSSYDAANKRQIPEEEEANDSWDSLLLPISLLLKGFAVENLLKGIIYSKDPDRLKENDNDLLLDGAITNHKLVELYWISGLAKNRDAIDPETKEILGILEQIIIWQGRYPVPLNLTEYKRKKQIPEMLRNPEKINDLFNRLFITLNSIPRPPTHR